MTLEHLDSVTENTVVPTEKTEAPADIPAPEATKTQKQERSISHTDIAPPRRAGGPMPSTANVHDAPDEDANLTLETAFTEKPKEPEKERLGNLAKSFNSKTPTPAQATEIELHDVDEDIDFVIQDTRPSFVSTITRFFTSAVVFSALVGTLYYYFSIEEPALDPVVQRDAPLPERQQRRPTTKNTTQCESKVDSDPRGAVVYFNGEARGKTPTVLFGPCGTGARIQLRLPGYEDVNSVISINEQSEDFYRTLVKIPQGILELTLSQNATIYVNGIALKQEAKAGVPIRLSLRADTPHVLRFENRALKLNLEKQYTLRTNEYLKDRPALVRPAP
jgi:hypothetical protein